MRQTLRSARFERPLAVVLGTNEIASAVGVYLNRSGRAVLLSHDPLPPVMRRGMAFHDALFGDPALLEGIEAKRIDYVTEAFEVLAQRNRVAVTDFGLTDLLVLGKIDTIVDARMQKYNVTPDFRGLARITIGLGPGFEVYRNCDVAVETHPASNGTVLRKGETAQPDNIPCALGDAGQERFIYSQAWGRWRTALEIGARVFKGVVVGHHGAIPVTAPIDGNLRGIVRDGTDVAAGVKLIEVDPRGRASQWTGLDERPRKIAEATMLAIRFCEAQRAFAHSVSSLLPN